MPRAPDRAGRLALVHPDDRLMPLDASPDPRSGSLPHSCEFRVRFPDGTYRWLASRSAPLFDSEGALRGRVGVNWDITETKGVELTRQQAQIAERENLAKSRFLGRMSHELRTPLNAVLGFTQLLEREARRETAVERAATLGHIRVAGEHLLTLITDALDLSRLDAGSVVLDLQPMDVGAVIGQALPLIRDLAEQHGVRIECGRLEGTVRADPIRLRQVLLNLLTNAIKYNRAPGRVTIDAVGGPPGRLRVRVRDTGRGISPDRLPELFEPFNRLGVQDEEIEGTGLGLTIAKALVEAMGGQLEVESRFGVGTVFEIVLPSVVGHEPVPRSAEREVRDNPAAQPSGGDDMARAHVLYIEDNEVNVLVVDAMLHLRPHLTLTSAPNGTPGRRAGASAHARTDPGRHAVARFRRFRSAAAAASRTRHR